MEAQVKLANGLFIKVEGDTQMDLFKEIAGLHEVFAEEKCGLCGEKDLKFVVRTAQEYEFPEMHCKKCFAKLSFGQNQKPKGGLFPIRKLTVPEGKPCREQGKFGPHNGWTKYKGEPKTDTPQKK